MVLSHVIDTIRASENVPELVTATYLHCDVMFLVQVPPIPGLHHRVEKFGQRHGRSVLQS